MTRYLLSLASLVMMLALAAPVRAEGTVRLTSLEWPPFSGAQLPGLGASVAVARAAFAAVETGLEVEFYPWQRAVKTGLESAGYAGYFPEYFSEELLEKCLFSQPAGDSPLGFVERKDAPVVWSGLDDLSSLVIGTVSGYVNTAEFDRRAADGRIRAEPVVDDMTNIRKVAARRVSLAVIDRNVFEHLLGLEPSLADIRTLLQFNVRPLENKGLYICFRKDAVGVAAKKLFDDGVTKINVQMIMADGLRQANQPAR